MSKLAIEDAKEHKKMGPGIRSGPLFTSHLPIVKSDNGCSVPGLIFLCHFP